MATESKKLTYNDLALRLDRLRSEYRAQGGNGTLGSGSIVSQLKGREGSQALADQIDAIQKQMAQMEPKLSGDPQSYIQAQFNIQDAESQVRSLLDGGTKQTDPKVTKLLQTIKDQTLLIKEQTDYNEKIKTLHSNATEYVKNQNQMLENKKQGGEQAAAAQEQIQKLQNEKLILQAKGEPTDTIDKQISTLNDKNNLAQVEMVTGTPEVVSKENAPTSTRTPDVQPTTAFNKPASTGATGTTGSTGGTPPSTGGDYTTAKGVLSYQGNPLTGEYQGKYYNQGKIETPAQVKADFMAKYGEQAKFIASVPELGNLLTTAIAQNWAPTQWATQFANTQWAQTHPGDIGLAEIKRISAPEQYNTEYNAAQSRVASLAESLGIKLTPQQLGSQVDIKTPPALDQNAVTSGQDMTNWLMQHPNASDAQITQQMAKYGTIDPTTGPGGTLKQFSNNLQNLAQQYGVLGQVSTDGTSKVFDNLAATEAAAGGNISDPAILAKYENQYRTQAMATYKPFADQIANGAKVSDLASPYLSTYASLMEVNPSDIQLGALTGPGAMVSKALTGDANGQIVNPYDFASQVRSQPAWLNTQNAHATVNSAADYMISKMGMG
jgi:hypothetical protein